MIRHWIQFNTIVNDANDTKIDTYDVDSNEGNYNNKNYVNKNNDNKGNMNFYGNEKNIIVQHFCNYYSSCNCSFIHSSQHINFHDPDHKIYTLMIIH